jgi:hypothetical protein
MTKKSNKVLALVLDDLTLSRLKKQAARVQGGIEGAAQSYIRAAVLKQLNEDEEKLESMRQKVADPA